MPSVNNLKFSLGDLSTLSEFFSELFEIFPGKLLTSLEHFGKLSALFAGDLVMLSDHFGKLSKSFAGELTGKFCFVHTLPHVVDSCIDKNCNFPSWKQNGACQMSSDVMKDWCPHSCGLCNGEQYF